MEPLVKSDVFFFISSIAICMFTIFGLIVSVYIIKIVKNFHDVSAILKQRVQATDAEIGNIVAHIHKSAIFRFIFGKPKK